MRAFVGVPVPEAWIAPIAGIRSQIGVGREVPDHNLHVTLAFLGTLSDRQAGDVHEALDRRAFIGCRLAASGLATYGGSHPKLLALDLATEPELMSLQGDVARAIRQTGLSLERRRFRPHITLRRFGAGLAVQEIPRLNRELRGLALPHLVPAEVRAMVLYRSHLGPGGADYEPLAQYLLR